MDRFIGKFMPTAPGPGDEPPEKPYYSKRPHKKSRNGCEACKARKIKCDETRPVCQTCTSRSQECIFPNFQESTLMEASASTPAVMPDHRPGSRVEALTTSSLTFTIANRPVVAVGSVPDFRRPFLPPPPPVVIGPFFRPWGVDMTDMRLLWHFTTHTCSTFSVEGGARKPAEKLLREDSVQLAFGNPFLMQTLFALAGLHQQNLRMTFDRRRALCYRTKTFRSFNEALSICIPETLPALLVNSLLLTALTSQNFRDWDGKDLYIIDWMMIWRGIRLIFDSVDKRELANSGLQALLHRPSIDLWQAAAAIPVGLLLMVDGIGDNDPDHAFVEAYRKTLTHLGSLYHNLRQDGLGAVMRLRIITWFTFLPDRFVELVR
ncbi:hypothetical protein CDD83_4714 [Cordyceps sp. RAO-2017]|nr:hypothetical protein CDD83_4714 [Cordyceps sp. RAO-2017]